MQSMRIFIAAMLVSLLTQVCYAQMGVPGPIPPSAEEKAAAARKRAEEIETDKAYKSMLKQTPAATQKVDPWGDVRTAPATGKQH